MMILCKWRRGHDTEEQCIEDGEFDCDGIYRSYRVDDVSLNGQDLKLEENEFQPDKSQSLIEVNTKNVTSTDSGNGFPANDLLKTPLILNTADLELNSEKLELSNLESGSRDAKKTEETPFFSHLMNFFTSLICGSRSILTLDTDVTISTIKKLSCETVELDMSNISRLIDSCNDGEGIGRDENKSLENMIPRKTTGAFTHQQFSLRRANSLPNIKLKDFQTKSTITKEHDVLIAYPKVQSMEEQVKQYEASTLHSGLFFKSMRVNYCSDKDESEVSGFGFPHIGITHMYKTELGKIMKLRNKGWEKLCFTTQIPRPYSYFYYKTKTNFREFFNKNQGEIFSILKEIDDGNELLSADEKRVGGKAQKLIFAETGLTKLNSESPNYE